MNYYRQSGLSSIPPVVKNILIINVLFFAATYLLEAKGISLINILGLHYFKSDLFQPYQIITHMFMHGGLMHIAFNMYALWMFGKILEQVWGPKKLLIYYMVTGLGAALLYSGVQFIEATMLRDQLIAAGMSQSDLTHFISTSEYNTEILKHIGEDVLGKYWLIYHTPVVGASGAVFGLLLAFGMLFPNVELYLMFIPMPIKAKYFVMGYGAIELFGGLANRAGDNTAHFAHLGGMLFGFILIKMWKKKGELY